MIDHMEIFYLVTQGTQLSLATFGYSCVLKGLAPRLNMTE